MNRSGIFLAMLALAAALFAPSGFMPARAADGSIVIRICSELDGGQEKVVQIDPRTGEMRLAGAGEESPEGKRCDFANAGVADLPPLPSFASPQAIFRQFASAPMDALARLSATGLPPSTGPPLA